MANTYTQLYTHVVFVVKYRKALISSSWKDELYKFITGIVTNKGHKLLAIGGVEDHIHILIGMKPHQSLSDLARDIKRSSSLWINQTKALPFKFEWQGGFAAFSCSTSHMHNAVTYILGQEEHHKKKTTRDEFVQLLEAYDIDYDEKYIFQQV